MERATLARPYAEAIAKLAAEGSRWPLWSERLALIGAVAGDPQIVALAGNPSVPGERVIEVILSVCGDRLDAEGDNLVRLLAENKRLGIVVEIVAQFEAMKAAQEGVLEAHVTTAFEIGRAQLDALVARLETKFGRKVNATQSTDPTLIGGVVIQVGDEVMDASVRGRLESLAVTLRA